MTKMQIADMMFIKVSVCSVVIDSSGNSHIGIVQGFDRENGSGQCFNVRISKLNPSTGERYIDTVFVRTID